MGTGGFVGFVIDKTEKIFVSHGSAYPSAVGSGVLSWLTDHKGAVLNPAPGGVPDQIRALRLVDESTGLTEADIERLRDLLDGRPGCELYQDFIEDAGPDELLEFATYDLDALLLAGIVWDGSDFPADSILCEWGYLIDLDTATFEVYRGFQYAPHQAGRFANRPRVDQRCHPVALVASWPLANLPDRAGFVALLDPA